MCDLKNLHVYACYLLFCFYFFYCRFFRISFYPLDSLISWLYALHLVMIQEKSVTYKILILNSSSFIFILFDNFPSRQINLLNYTKKVLRNGLERQESLRVWSKLWKWVSYSHKILNLTCVSWIYIFASLLSANFGYYFNQTHLTQVENDYKERLEKEASARQQLGKVWWFLLLCFLSWICKLRTFQFFFQWFFWWFFLLQILSWWI